MVMRQLDNLWQVEQISIFHKRSVKLVYPTVIEALRVCWGGGGSYKGHVIYKNYQENVYIQMDPVVVTTVDPTSKTLSPPNKPYS